MTIHPDNIKAARALVKRYRSITFDDIQEVKKDLQTHLHFPYLSNFIAKELTGYGSTSNCTLCLTVTTKSNRDCQLCIYGSNYHCTRGSNTKTYDNIEDAPNARALLAAFRARAKHIETILKDIDNA
jgi:hypothetical protein